MKRLPPTHPSELAAGLLLRNSDPSVNPDDYPADEAFLPALTNEAKRMEAFKQYMCEVRPSKIAQELGVENGIIIRWIAHGKWAGRLRELRATRVEEDRVTLELFRGENRQAEVEAQLKAGRRGQEIVQEMMEREGITPDGIKKLADALKAFSDINARAVGVGETVESAAPIEDEKAGRRAPPAVVIIQSGDAPITVREAGK